MQEDDADHRFIAVYVDPGNASISDVAELYASLDAFYQSHGGSGLRVVRDEIHDLVGLLGGRD